MNERPDLLNIADGKMRQFHMCQSIRGPLTNWKWAEWNNATKWIKRDDGSCYTADELKQAFLDELSEGHEVVPIGKCDNFDFQRGCLGHETEETT